MKNKVKNIVKFLSFCMAFVFVAVLFSACSLTKEKDTSYAISGYVYDDFGVPVEDVTITSDISVVKTDKDGKYTISGIESSVIITASKVGYKFKDISKAITSSNDDANFVAYKEYKITGKASNNGVGLVNANVTATSLSGVFYTTTDEEGNFIFNGVAGESVISCEVDELQFYETKTTIDNPNVLIETTSSLTINFAGDENIDFSKVELFVDGEKVALASSKKVIDSVKCGSEVEIKTDAYKLDKPSKFIITSLDQVENFYLSKIYSVSGKVSSGETTLANASIRVNDVEVSTNETGIFSISGLYGKNNLSVTLAGFNFVDIEISKDSSFLEINGTKDIFVKIDYDYIVSGSIVTVPAGNVQDNGEILIEGVELGQKVSLSSNEYHLSKTELTVSNADKYTLSANAKYNAEVTILGDFEFEFVLDGKVVSSDKFSGLFGKHTISAKFENYKFTEASVSYLSQSANLTYIIPYSTRVTAKSGDIEILDFSVECGGNTFISNEDGYVLLENLTGKNIVKVVAEKYNSCLIEISSSEGKQANLTYFVSGSVKTGDYEVISAVVSAGSAQTETDENGKFVLTNLSGQVEISVQKQGFDFGSAKVASKNSVFDFNGTYSISGILSSDGVFLENTTVKVVSTSDMSETNLVTDENGKYSLSGLSGEYWIYPQDVSLGLMPRQYVITTSGENYNFNTSGFSVSGFVKTGNVPIAKAKVMAGSDAVYTDSDGKYKFELLTSECEISVEKEGYEFSSPILVLEETTDLNFTATYKVVGTIFVGETPLEGVRVSAGEIIATTNNAGEFEISGLTGSVNLTFEKENYTFESVTSISGYKQIEVYGKTVATIIVKTGDTLVLDFVAYQNGTPVEVVDGKVKVVANVGDVITFEKEGYVIASVVITEPKSYIASASYKVLGKVVSGTEAISGASIKIYGKQVGTTNALGEFEIQGLIGDVNIQVEKNGFIAETKDVSGYEQSLKIDLSYEITVSAKVGSKLLDGVLVKVNGQEQITAGAKLTFVVSGRFDISAEKQGYTFEGVSNKFGKQDIVLVASYSVSGKVLSGTIAVDGADISIGEKTTKTDENGEFVVDGIQGNCSLIISKDGYNTQTIKGITDKSRHEIKDFSYSFTINFDKTDVTVFVNGKPQVVTGKSINLTGLVGKNVVKFSRANTSFSVNNLEIKKPGSISVTTSVSYTASGYVKTSNGLAVSGIKIVSASGDETVTDSNGYYQFDNVAGAIYIADENITRDQKTVASDGEYNFTISNFEFGYYLYANGYKNLDNAASFQIIGRGSVNPSMGGSQQVYSLVKKDNNGRKIKQNLNYGSEILGIDPKVSLVAYFDGVSWYYDQIKNVNTDLTANHSAGSLKKISISDYQSIYGASPEAYMPYNFSKSSGINSISTVSLNGNNYKFTIELNTSSSVYSLYAKQMKALSNQDVTSFEYIRLNYVINKNGWIVDLVIDEKYQVKTASVKITSSIDYKFTTQKPNIKINDIDVSSDEKLKASLIESSQTEIEIVSTSSKNSGNIVSKLIYGY